MRVGKCCAPHETAHKSETRTLSAGFLAPYLLATEKTHAQGPSVGVSQRVRLRLPLLQTLVTPLESRHGVDRSLNGLCTQWLIVRSQNVSVCSQKG